MADVGDGDGDVDDDLSGEWVDATDSEPDESHDADAEARAMELGMEAQLRLMRHLDLLTAMVGNCVVQQVVAELTPRVLFSVTSLWRSPARSPRSAAPASLRSIGTSGPSPGTAAPAWPSSWPSPVDSAGH